MNVGDDEYVSGDEGNIFEEDERRAREYFSRVDENFPLILSISTGGPLVIYKDRGYTCNKRKQR